MYVLCNNNEVIGSESVTMPEENKVEIQGNDIMCPKNPFECVLVKDFEQYDVKSESPDMANWSMLGTKGLL